MKRLRIPVAAVLLALTLAGTAFAEMVYHRGNGGAPETLDPQKTGTAIEGYIVHDLYEGLVTHSAAAEIIPGVAKSWEISADGTIYTFHFRDDAKWSNGEPVTAGDFVFSFHRLLAPRTAAVYASLYYPIRNAKAVNSGALDPSELGVRALDDKTLEITLEALTPYFIEVLAQPTAVPVYPPSVKKYGEGFVKPGKMVSNGAYRLESALPNTQVTIVKNPYFHDAENVAIDKVIFYPTDDYAAALCRFSTGELDSQYNAPLEQAQWMRKHLGRQFHVSPELGIYYYALNTEKPPFNDRRVCRALSMAIDRKFLAEKIWNGAMLPGYGFVPPGIPNYGEPVMLDFKDQPIFDREDEAAELMREAGYGPKHPLKVRLSYYTDDNDEKTALAIADMWKPLGVDVGFVKTGHAAHHVMLHRRGDFDIARAGWLADYPDAQNFLFLLQSDNPHQNYARYRNAQFDVLMAEAAESLDANRRKAILHEAQARIEHDEPNIPLLYYDCFNLVSDKLKGWEDNSLNIHLSRWMRIER